MSRFADSRVAPLRYSRILASAPLIERCLAAGTGSQERWNFGAVSQSAFGWLGVMEPARKKSGSADRGTAKDTEHSWSTLTTITTFDLGNKSTFRLNTVDEDQTNRKIGQQGQQQITPATGVLIESLLQQLCTLLEGDNVRRNKLYYAICDKLHELQLINDTYNLREFEMLRGKYQRALYHLVSVARGTESETALSISRFVITPELFRYHQEFRETSFIARGGFGEVYKARHRLDGTEYAIKKIYVHANRIEIIKQQLNEVRTLAKLNHTNIVPYKAAWIEPTFDQLPSPYISKVPSTNRESYNSASKYQKKSKSHNSSNSSSTEDLFTNGNGLNLNDSKIYYSKQSILLDTKATCTSDMYTDMRTKERNKVYGSADYIVSHGIISKRYEELNSSIDIIGKRIVEENNIEESNSDVVSFRNSKSNENLDRTDVDTDISNSYSREGSSSQELCTYTSNKNQQYMILYIQMALCEQTLEQWLGGKISVTPEPMIRAIFQQILYGVDYMHSENIVHHDIKPSNIFISTSGRLQIQLGDFGLACPLQRKNRHPVGGTRMYAAPEQLQGKCDPKSDIYSIGIILIELSIPIKTQMELSTIIRCLKDGKVPEALERYKWAPMVKQLVQDDPIERPWTKQLLQDFSEDKDVIITGLKNTIVNLKNDNRDKDIIIQELREEIALLQKKFQKLNVSSEIMTE